MNSIALESSGRYVRFSYKNGYFLKTYTYSFCSQKIDQKIRRLQCAVVLFPPPAGIIEKLQCNARHRFREMLYF